MNLDKLFYDNLFDEELHSFEDNNVGFELKKNLKIEILHKDASPILNATIGFTDELKKNLASIYSQTRSLSGGWQIMDSTTNELLESFDAIKNLSKTYEISIDEIKSELVGTINIVAPLDMLNREKYDYSYDDGTRYIPFDLHYELMACFKVENNKVEDNIYILNVQDSEVIYNMGVGCLKYLELAYKAKLFYQWQYAYTTKDGIYNKLLNTMLPIIFPSLELDLSDFN